MNDIKTSIVAVEYKDGDFDRLPKLYFYLRGEDKKKYVRIVEGFNPYFYIKSIERSRLKRMRYCHINHGYRGIFGEKLSRVEVYSQRDLKGIRQSGVFSELFESDLPYPTRYLIDKGIRSGVMMTSEGLVDCDIDFPFRVWYVDIENKYFGGSNKEMTVPITCIGFYDNYDETYYTLLVSSSKHIDSWKKSQVREYKSEIAEMLKKQRSTFRHEIIVVDDEKALLEKFSDLVVDKDVDIFTGWNVKNFDMVYILKRMEDNSVDSNRLSPFGTSYYKNDVENEVRDAMIRGRVILDLYKGYKRLYWHALESFKLDDVGNHEFKTRKIEFDGWIGELWENDLEKFVEYNTRDIEICVYLNDKYSILEVLDTFRKMSGCEFSDVHMNSRIIDIYVLREVSNKHILPDKNHLVEKIMKKIVKAVNEQGYQCCRVDNREISIDFTGNVVEFINKRDNLYRKINSMMNGWMNTLGYSTNCFEVKSLKGFERLPKSMKKIQRINRYLEMMYSRLYLDVKSYSGGFVLDPMVGLYNWLSSFDLKSLYPSIMIEFNISPDVKDNINGEIRTPNRVGYRKTQGLFTSILKYLIQQRDLIRNQLEGLTGDEYYRKYKKQYGYKTFTNSFYGNCGYVGNRLYDPDLAASVTAYGRYLLTEIIKLVRQRGFDVVRGDTDSVYVMIKSDDLQYVISQGKLLEKDINDNLRIWAKGFGCSGNNLSIKNEHIYDTFFSGQEKKLYAGKLLWDWKKGILKGNPKVKEDDLYEIKGFGAKRSDRSKFTRKLQQTVLEMILNNASYTEIRDYVRDEVDKFVGRKYPLDRIAIPKGLGKHFNEYAVENPWIRGSKYSSKNIKGYEYSPKPKLLYVKEIPGLPRTEVVCFNNNEEIPVNTVIDWEKMTDISIIKPLQKIFDVMKYDSTFIMNRVRGQKCLSEY